MANVVWHGARAKAAADAAAHEAVLDAALEVAEQMRRNIGSEGGAVIGSDLNRKWMQGPPSPFKKRRRGKARYYASPPGAFPGWRTGNLAKSMSAAHRSRLVAVAGSPLKYGYWLEHGTSKMPARPWAVRSLYMARPLAVARFHSEFRRRFNAGMRGGA